MKCECFSVQRNMVTRTGGKSKSNPCNVPFNILKVKKCLAKRDLAHFLSIVTLAFYLVYALFYKVYFMNEYYIATCIK